MPVSNNCPCGSSRPYTDCCQPVHQSHPHATHPEQLMRARYSAHVLGLVDFVIATYHPSCNAEQHREAITDSIHSDWQRLEVLSSDIASDNEGFVAFKAFYLEDNEPFCLQETSRFVKEDGCWFYIDGDYPSTESETPAPSKPISGDRKPGRNDPCSCGSGKKYKKCCG